MRHTHLDMHDRRQRDFLRVLPQHDRLHVNDRCLRGRRLRDPGGADFHHDATIPLGR